MKSRRPPSTVSSSLPDSVSLCSLDQNPDPAGRCYFLDSLALYIAPPPRLLVVSYPSCKVCTEKIDDWHIHALHARHHSVRPFFGLGVNSALEDCCAALEVYQFSRI